MSKPSVRFSLIPAACSVRGINKSEVNTLPFRKRWRLASSCLIGDSLREEEVLNFSLSQLRPIREPENSLPRDNLAVTDPKQRSERENCHFIL